MRTYEIAKPTHEQACKIAQILYTEIKHENAWGKHFVGELSNDTLEVLVALGPRTMRQALVKAFGKAALAKRDHLIPEDIGVKHTTKPHIGFVNS